MQTIASLHAHGFKPLGLNPATLPLSAPARSIETRRPDVLPHRPCFPADGHDDPLLDYHRTKSPVGIFVMRQIL